MSQIMCSRTVKYRAAASPVYIIKADTGSVTIGSNVSYTTYSSNLAFFRRVSGQEDVAYSCYYTVFRKLGSTYTKIKKTTSKATTGYTSSIKVEERGTSTNFSTDAIVICMYDTPSEEHSGYLAELEIPVRKNGDNGEDGQDGQDGQDGKDAATLVFEPDVVFVPCDSDGMSTDAVNKSVAFFIEIKGTRYTPDSNTATAQVVGQDIDYTFSNNKTILNVDIGSGYSDIEGYIKVTATKMLNGVPYTASGCLSVVASLQGESGPRGKTGPMSYLAGDYDDTVNYGALLTDTSCPVVHFVNGTTDEYWYPTEDYRGAGYDPSVANGWKKAYDFEMVVTKILFTQFAKLGGFVVSGDFMLSQYGELIDADGNKLTLTQSTDSDGSTHWRYNGVDAYTYFRDYDPMAERYRDMTPSTYFQYYNRGMDYPLLVRNNWQYWSNYESTSDAIYITLNSGDTHINDLKSLAVGGYYILCGTDTNSVFHCLLMRKSQAVGTNNRLYGYREKIMSHLSQTMFRPIKVVNAATGEEWLAGGKVHVGADGDVTVEGTIKAKNLYRNLCLFSGGVYSNNWYYVNSVSDAVTENFPNAKVGDYVQSDSEYTGLIHCTYDADIIQMVPVNNTNQYPSDLILPKPQDFQNKVVEINGWSITTSEVDMYVKCVVNDAMANAVSINNGRFEPDSPTSRVTIKTGSTFKFMSMLLSGTWRWVKLNEK